MVAKRETFCIAGLAVFCAAVVASSHVQPLRAGSSASGIDNAIQRASNGRTDLPRTFPLATPARRTTEAATLRLSRLLRYLDAAIPSGAAIAPAPVPSRLDASFPFSLSQAPLWREPTSRAPPSLSNS